MRLRNEFRSFFSTAFDFIILREMDENANDKETKQEFMAAITANDTAQQLSRYSAYLKCLIISL